MIFIKLICLLTIANPYCSMIFNTLSIPPHSHLGKEFRLLIFFSQYRKKKSDLVLTPDPHSLTKALVSYPNIEAIEISSFQETTTEKVSA